MSITVLSAPPSLAMEQGKTTSVLITSIPVPREAVPPGFKLVQVKKPDGSIVTVKRKVSAAHPEILANTVSAVQIDSGYQPSTSPTNDANPTSTTIESPTATPAETAEAQVADTESQVPEILNVKPEKSRMSFAWLGKKEKPRNIINQLAGITKSPLAKLRAAIGKPTDRTETVENAVGEIETALTGDDTKPTIASSEIVNTASTSTSQHVAVHLENGLKNKLAEGAASVGLDIATHVGTHKANSALHTIEHEAKMLQHAMSKHKLGHTSNDSRYRNNNNNDGYDQTNAAAYSENTNDAGVYEDWNSEDEEVDPTDYITGDNVVGTKAVYSGASGQAADSLAQVNDNGDEIEDFNPDTDELFDEADPNAIYSSAQDGGQDDIEDFNPNTDELFDEENMSVDDAGGGDEGEEVGDNKDDVRDDDTDDDDLDSLV
jgi:hypothetical protein